MNLLLLGLDHTTAPVHIRERLAFAPEALPKVLQYLTKPHDQGEPLLREAAILSTCNRVEIYGTTNRADALPALVQFLADFHSLDPEAFAPLLFQASDMQVAEQLCATAGGLRSLVLGEAQIQGQVRQAYELAQEAASVGPVLHRLFQHALSAGKQIRHETALGQGAASVAQAGVELARRRLGSLRGQRVLLIGSGEMGELAAQNLIAHGADRLMVTNRTFEHGRALAARYKAQHYSFADLELALANADIVISSTAAPMPILQREQLERALANRMLAYQLGQGTATPPMLLIDLAVPRDIADDVATLPGVHVYTIDDLHEVVRSTLDKRALAAADAEAIVRAEVGSFAGWLRSQDAIPTLSTLRQYAENLRVSELDRVMRRLDNLSPEQRTIVEAFSQSLVNKLLHSPTRRVRDAAAQGEGQRYAAMLSDLFNLELV